MSLKGCAPAGVPRYPCSMPRYLLLALALLCLAACATPPPDIRLTPTFPAAPTGATAAEGNPPAPTAATSSVFVPLLPGAGNEAGPTAVPTDTPLPTEEQTAAPEQMLEPLATAAGRNGAAALAERLAELRTWLADDLEALEQAVAGVHAGPDGAPRTELDLAERSAAWLLARPGKRIRPLCVMLAGRCGKRRRVPWFGAASSSSCSCPLKVE